MEEEKVPVSQVLDDMYGDKGMISYAARDYYFLNYATDEERKQMLRNEATETWVARIVLLVFAALLVTVIILNLR